MKPEDFKEWLKQRHMSKCSECKDKGEGRIMDDEVVAYYLFKEFYDYKTENGS